jgi:hypothetical protein
MVLSLNPGCSLPPIFSVPPVSHIPIVSDERVVKKHRRYSNCALTPRLKVLTAALCDICGLPMSRFSVLCVKAFVLLHRNATRLRYASSLRFGSSPMAMPSQVSFALASWHNYAAARRLDSGSGPGVTRLRSSNFAVAGWGGGF